MAAGDRLKKAMQGSSSFRGMGKGHRTQEQYQQDKDARQAVETENETNAGMEDLARSASDTTPVAPRKRRGQP